jgi:O-acetyl-ADP-ribose deacetylase (regulator of RNase III)
MTGSLTYVKGDATQPAGESPRFIIHVCNDLGLWGSGFVLAVSARWPQPEAAYYRMGERCNGYAQGNIDIVEVDENLWVVNMIGQKGVARRGTTIPPVRYSSIRNALTQVAEAALDEQYRGPFKSVAIHCPKFGAGLAGGDWRVIEQIIQEELVDKGLEVTVYEFDG